MKHVLIITEDIVKIQTLTGILGKIFKFIYLNWLKFRLKFLIFILNPFCQMTVICSDYFKLNSKNVFFYSQLLSDINYADNRLFYLKLVDNLLKDIDAPLFKTRLSIFLTYHYYIYADLYQKFIKDQKPDLIITLSNSYHEQIARFISKLQNIKALKLHFLTLISINHFLKKFFLNREYSQKIKNFLSQVKKPQPNIKKMNKAVFLSLDFHRHLKTLAPIYQELVKQNKNPWIITDILNLEPTLKNLRLEKANVVYLASFLFKNYQAKAPLITLKSQKEINLDSFLHNLSLKTALPIIKHSLVLQNLYLQASKNLFKLTNPKALAVVSDLRYQELALSLMAQKNQVNSVLVSPNTLLGLEELNPYDTTQKVALVGQFIKDKLTKQGLNPQKLFLVGDLRTENYQMIKQQLNRKEVYQKLGLSLNKKIVLVISFRPTWMIPKPEKQAFFQMAAKAVDQAPNTVLVVKPHPTEKRYRVVDELRQWGIKAIVSDNNQLELVDLLNASSVILQTWSMTIFEAIMMNRPVISINPGKKDYNFFLPILKAGGAIQIYSQSQLNHWFKILLNPTHPKTKLQLKKAKAACAQFIRPPDGKVAQRVVGLL